MLPLVDFLFPNRCLECNHIIAGEELICELCYSNIHFTNFPNTQNNLVTERCSSLFPLVEGNALFHFHKDSLGQKVIHQLKYGSREIVGIKIAEWTLENLNWTHMPDLITSIPLHPKKLKKRGYNQLHWFGNTLSRGWNIPIDHEVLLRQSHSIEQAKKNRTERRDNPSKFALQKEIRNQHILIIDDVLTTGNTMADAAWELLQPEFNNRVSVLVMALD